MPSIPVPGTGALRAPGELLDRVRRDVERNALRARNGIRLAAGVDRPRLGQTPKDLVWSSGRAELWRYRSDAVELSPPLLVVFSLVSRSYVLDLRPGNSFVEHLLAAGFDVFLLDWAPADARHAEERLEDYAGEYLPEAVRRTCAAAGSESVNLLGYCFGGVLACSTPRAVPTRRCARSPSWPRRSTSRAGACGWRWRARGASTSTRCWTRPGTCRRA
jgi:polyhydroxyalkanoate synthase